MMNKHRAGLLIKMLVVCLGLYVLIEILFYVLIGLYLIKPDVSFAARNDLSATDKPFARFDEKSGYKYIPGKFHTISITEGEITTDHWVHVNRQGYCSVFDYNPAKDSNTIRYMVLGDSYSAGEITDTTWADRLSINWNKKNNNKLELYNFSLDGGGIENWSLQVEHEIRHYAFDGLILAIFGDEQLRSFDLCRPLAVKHSFEKETKLDFLDSPVSIACFQKEKAGQLIYNSSIYSPEQIEIYKDNILHGFRFRGFHFFPPRLYFLEISTQLIRMLWRINSMQTATKNGSINPCKKIASGDTLEKLIPGSKAEKLNGLVKQTQKMGKQVIIVALPSLSIYKNQPDCLKNNLYVQTLQAYAEKNNCTFINGYELLHAIPYRNIDDFHLKGDMHWNRRCCDLFADFLERKLDSLQKTASFP